MPTASPAQRCLLSGCPGKRARPAAAVFQEPAAENARSIDPRRAWMLFIRQSDKGANAKRGSGGKVKKLEVSTSPCVCVLVFSGWGVWGPGTCRVPTLSLARDWHLALMSDSYLGPQRGLCPLGWGALGHTVLPSLGSAFTVDPGPASPCPRSDPVMEGQALSLSQVYCRAVVPASSLCSLPGPPGPAPS